MATGVRKFTFDDFFDFERPPEPVKTEDQGPPAIFTEIDLAEAKAQGCEEGRAQALVDFEASDEHRRTLAIERLADGLAAFGQAETIREQDFRAGALNVALVALRKVLPELARRVGQQEIEALTTEVLGEQAEEPRLVFRVPDSSFDIMVERIGMLATQRGFAGKPVVIAEEGLGQADCRIEWADGGIERVADRTLADVAAAIVRLSHTSDQPRAAAPKPTAAAEIFPAFEATTVQSGE